MKRDIVGILIGAVFIVLGLMTLPTGLIFILVGALTLLVSVGYKGAGIGVLEKAAGK
jgi:hypothetical protein